MESLLVLAQAARDGNGFPESVAPWASLGGNAIIGGILIYLITKRGPEERNEFRADMAAERASREKSQQDFHTELQAERASREEMMREFMAQQTAIREQSHAQRMEDRKVYMEATQAMLREFMQTAKEIRGNANQ